MLRRSICAILAGGMFAAPAFAFAQDATPCKLQKVVEWQVRSIGRHMAVDGAVNGQKIGIVLDTGAAVSVLFRAAARRLALDLKESTGERLFGVGGETKVEVAVIDEFKLEKWRCVACACAWPARTDPGQGFDLLLGEDFLAVSTSSSTWRTTSCACGSRRTATDSRSRTGPRTLSAKCLSTP